MDAYLEIAEKVLSQVRRPLSARQILNYAFKHNLVPYQLHGRTQHKTLGARLSEDILLTRDRSPFFRTGPGRFFLRKYLTDPSVPEEFRTPMIARRRQRELVRGRILTLPSSAVVGENEKKEFSPDSVIELFASKQYQYADNMHELSPRDLAVWAFVLVMRGEDVLTYRHGRYREERDCFLQRRSIGFFAPVLEMDDDLFDFGDRGVIAAGLKAIMMDLDLPADHGEMRTYRESASLCCFIPQNSEDHSASLLGVIHFECPGWFEPLKRRLAINDLRWMQITTPINDLEDFDPWSQRVIEYSQHVSSNMRNSVEREYEGDDSRAGGKATCAFSRSNRSRWQRSGT